MEEKYGEVEEMNVCDNLGDHLVGNVYVKVSVLGLPFLPSAKEKLWLITLEILVALLVALLNHF